VIVYIIYQFRIEKYYIFNLTLINICVAFICNMLVLFQLITWFFMAKKRCKRLT